MGQVDLMGPSLLWQRARRIRAESYHPKPLPADQKPINVLKKIANDDRIKWEMDLNVHGDRVKWVNDGKEEDWGTYTFRPISSGDCNPKPNSSSATYSFYKSQGRGQCRAVNTKKPKKRSKTVSICYKKVLVLILLIITAEVVRAICNDKQDAEEGAGQTDGYCPCGFRWRYVGMDACRCRIAPKQLRHNQKANLLFAVEHLLEDMVLVAVHCEVEDAAAVQ
ncbi:hypothetical protein DFH08DRAFT_807982 [Mycena albidolilacea]|uniref:Uncharacterized protein n=1 Tax=Mycena albidolilacea TaxID=1033008 RepID=A0AAD7ETJ1_9AGAR|nr:hypothetical protein DFH08DRAFT_807982 [Mycena albidolilacea]